MDLHDLLYDPKPHHMGERAVSVCRFSLCQESDHLNRNAFPCVGKGKLQETSLYAATDPDIAAFRVVADAVVDEVAEGAGKQPRISA